ncbi:Plasmodium exported protein, unknown function [Plasmodium knowlesi strain H]|uniref:Pv-fam-d protein n=3 Tax=Plasmodium knowlesi TaxID=5850 RepID=A0A1A7W442_PLAKH|nr:hypothetical protein, conserved in P.knowlesi [Plasmodium knowlesi strain H]OTN63704.1 Uncharacterized protein PKNOH_S140217600 [Plasmodium knowlesi]CAA9990604.1 hypothetical protein, conserved in P.knowlesi [Plasmodium knowlesi strain H]SBO26071.1 Plasmodium exported protein, unknown function [Plasmodium knowlesi strain H]SBO28755.1 hypothetical protein, conserved in P.knowlesi [Plasmodium knowlesi strain H]VVS80078.1 hypothetical protein, conserved in P.knowlesi [Plasmodium knowlesi strai
MISLSKLPLFIFVVYSWQCSGNYVSALSTLADSTSMESLFTKVQKTKFDKNGNADKLTNYDNSMESLFDRSMESLFPERRDVHGDYEDTITTDTYSQKGGYVDKHNYNSGEDFYHVMYKNNGHGQTKAKAKTGVHLPMFDEYPTEEHKYYNNSNNFHRGNTTKAKIHKGISFICNFLDKIDAKFESEMKRYLDIEEEEKHKYSIRKLKGTGKLSRFFSKYRVFAPLGVLGIVSLLILTSLLKMEFLTKTFPFAILASSSASFSLSVLFVISFILLTLAAAVVFSGYGLLLFYYIRKLNKMGRSRKYIKKLSAMRNKDDE